ncbi:MAG: TonB-dependent receptor [Chitinophagaceae bacterium]
MKQFLLSALSFLSATAIAQVSNVDSSFQKELIPVELKSVRANSKAPFTKTNLKKEDIAKLNTGADLPFVLNNTPNVVVQSDAGNGVGYTGLRIRGTDATRINFTLNGIPFNDAESQGTFFVNMPDFLSNVSSIQIQRGVGTSTNGVGNFGASVNMSTNEIIDKATAEINNSIGSFNTYKHTIKASSGLLNKHFTIDARLSKISSDGYVDRASSNLQAFYFSTAYFSKKSSLRLNIFSGKEITYQAWNGIDEATLKSNRTFNVSGTEKPGTPYHNETDNYNQTHYQLFYNTSISNDLKLSVTNFLTTGNGYYENYKANERFSKYYLPNVVVGSTTITRSDFIRQLWLDNDFYGQLINFIYQKKSSTITFGGGWSAYKGDHIGKLIWSKNGGLPVDYNFYNNPASKTEQHGFAKWEFAINQQWQLFSDVQYRAVQYTMNGFRNNPTLNIDRKFNFLNPKIGITYTKNGWQSFASYAISNKEPNRDDFEASSTTQPQHEQLHNIEIGVEKRWKKTFVAANFYGMFYNNQLVNTGKINDVGAYTRVNVDKSYRLGIELQATHEFCKTLNVAANFSLSRNKINSFIEYFDNYDLGVQQTINHQNTDISLSPNKVASLTINYLPTKKLELSLISKYVGKQYLDNTQNDARSLPAYYLQDVRIIYSPTIKNLSGLQIIAQANNIFNAMYVPNGYTFSYIAGGAFTTENYYFPMAGANFMLAVNIKL